MSSRHDIVRGFGSYAFLTLERNPRIVRAKLAAGFPHIGIQVSSAAIEATEYSLCRFNVAMTRYLRRSGNPGFPESSTNGRYYEKHQIPIARTDADKDAMLERHLKANTMIEVLIHGDLPLPPDTSILCFSHCDAEISKTITSSLNVPWEVVEVPAPGPYPRKPTYRRAVGDFIGRALEDPAWRGNGLEFDRV